MKPTQTMMSEPPKVPPVALGLFDEDDYIRHLGDKIAALPPDDADSLIRYLQQSNAIRIDSAAESA